MTRSSRPGTQGTIFTCLPLHSTGGHGGIRGSTGVSDWDGIMTRGTGHTGTGTRGIGIHGTGTLGTGILGAGTRGTGTHGTTGHTGAITTGTTITGITRTTGIIRITGMTTMPLAGEFTTARGTPPPRTGRGPRQSRGAP